MSEPKTRLVGEVPYAWMLVVSSLVIGYLAYQISGFTSLNSAGAFPLGVSLIMLLSALWCLGEALAKRRAPVKGMQAVRQFCEEHFPQRVVVFLALAIGFLLSMSWVSFYISAFIFIAVCIFYLRRGGVLMALGCSGMAMLVIYLLFTLVFSVYLP